MNVSTLRTFLFALCLAQASVSVAQMPEIIHSLDWREVYAGTNTPVASPDGVLEPGEAARVILSVSFTAVGTPVPYQNPPPGGIGTIAGFGNSVFMLIASNALGGIWSDPVVPPGFQGSLFGVGSNGSATFCAVGQGLPPNATNPLPAVWSAVWTPPNYDPRQASFQIQQRPPPVGQTAAHLHVVTGFDPGGNPLFGSADSIGVFGGPVVLPIIPAPGSGVLLLGLVFASSRRRVG